MAQFDLSKLNGRIVERYGSRKKFVEAHGLSPGKLYPSLQGRRPFRTDEIEALRAPDCLDIPVEQIHDYFFSLKVR